MLLYLVRHAFAGQHGDPRYPDDSLRPLTKQGRKQFSRMVKKLARGEFAPAAIAISPYLRCKQTADALAERIVPEPKLDELVGLEPGGAWPALIDWSNEQNVQQLAWVCHAPDIDEMAAALVRGESGTFKFGKGAIAAVQFGDRIAAGAGTLQWLIVPKLVVR